MTKQMKALEDKNKIYKQQLNDIKEIKTQLTDQMNKEINSIANPAFKTAIAFYEKRKTDLVASFLLKTLTAYISSNAEAEVNTKDAHWKDPAALQEALRNVKTRNMDKAWIREHMDRITGESGIPEQDGDIYKAISDGANTKNYVNFFPFFKVLSKMLHLGMILKKEEEMSKRVTQNNRSINQMAVKIKVSNSIENEAVHLILATEAERIRNNELAQLQQKKQNLERKKA
jgi:hypothetical protein